MHDIAPAQRGRTTAFRQNVRMITKVNMKKTVLIIYSNMFDVSALALRNFLKEDGKYNVIAVSEKEYDSFHVLKNFMRAYKYSYRHNSFFNNLITNFPSAEVERKKDSDGNEVNFKPTAEAFARFKKLENICMRYDAEYVVCTSQFGIKRAVLAREKYGLSGKIYALLTDFDLQHNFINKYLDGYFVITKKTKDELTERGIDADKIYVINMPLERKEAVQDEKPSHKRPSKVHSEPSDTTEKIIETVEEPVSKDDIKKKFNIRNDLPIITILGGRYGSKYSYNALRDVAGFKDCNILVITDGNKTIFRKFSRWSKKNECTHNIYFADNVKGLEEVYRITDYLIAAPTSAICFEAITRGIPLILMDSANNVETKNSKYLVSNGFAYSGISNERIKTAMAGYLKDIKGWKEHCENNFTDNGCEKFLEILDLIDSGVDPNNIPVVQEEVPEEKGDEVKEEITVKKSKWRRRNG